MVTEQGLWKWHFPHLYSCQSNHINGETSWSLLIFPPNVTLYLLEGTIGSHMIIGHVHTPTKVFGIKAAAEAVGLSLQADVNCDGTPSLETKAFTWTIILLLSPKSTLCHKLFFICSLIVNYCWFLCLSLHLVCKNTKYADNTSNPE